MIEPKDLMLAEASEIVPGYTFYKKEDDGTFARCVIDKDEIKDQGRRSDLLWLTKKYLAEKKLFRRINDPGKSFVK